jgi:hypothetical protein
MQHQQVIDNFVRNGEGGRGTYLKADADVLYSRFPENYRPYGRYLWGRRGETTTLAVRLGDEGVLVNGTGFSWPVQGYQQSAIRALQGSHQKFGAVPFHSIAAAFSDGKVRNWDEAPVPLKDLQHEVGIVVPSEGERWQEVTEKDKHGRTHTKTVHTLGDSVVRVRDHYYLSAVDPTGWGRGMYFLAELQTDRAPQTLAEAFDALKPKVVLEAEARGANVRRQGEWFAIPTKLLTSELMKDISRGLAVYRQRHVLGRDGHHELEEAVIYRVGPRKGEVYARGVLRHTNNEHEDLDLGIIRWHMVVHNIQPLPTRSALEAAFNSTNPEPDPFASSEGSS